MKKNGKKKYLVVGNKFITYYPSHSVSPEGGQRGGGGLTVEEARVCDCLKVLWLHSAVTVTLSSRHLVLGLSGWSHVGNQKRWRESGCDEAVGQRRMAGFPGVYCSLIGHF